MKAASLCSRNLQAYKGIMPQIIFFNPGIKFSLAKCYYAKRVFNNLMSVAFEKLILRNRVLFLLSITDSPQEDQPKQDYVGYKILDRIICIFGTPVIPVGFPPINQK